MYGDGHTAAESEVMKNSEDDIFHFVFTWIKNDENDKGWVIHYRPKRPPLSSEINSVFKFLNIKSSNQCPCFDFETCSWRSIRFIQRGDSYFDGNADRAYGWFDAHAENFSLCLKAWQYNEKHFHLYSSVRWANKISILSLRTCQILPI